MLQPGPSSTALGEPVLSDRHRVAVLIPCYNEEVTIAAVVSGFRASLPSAAIYVYDNNSSDASAAAARTAGAIVRRETRQGKGHVVRRMFADVDADVYVLVDGDGTYDAPSARAMIARLIDDRLDRQAVGLPRVQPPVREILSPAFGGIRDRDGTHYSCPRAPSAGRGNFDALLPAPARLRRKAQHLARRAAHPLDHPSPLQVRTATGFLRRHRRRRKPV